MNGHDTSAPRDESGATSPTGTDAGPHPAHRPARLVRLPDEGPGAGIAAGLGAYFGIDPVLFRIAFIILAMAGGSGVMLYAVGWLVIPPAAPGEVPARAGGPASDRTAQWVGIGLILAAVLWLAGPFDAGGPVLWAVALIAVGVILFREDADRRAAESHAGRGPAADTSAGWSAAGTPASGGPAGGERGGGSPLGEGQAGGPAPPTPAPAEVDEEAQLLAEAARLREGEGWSTAGWDPPRSGWSPVPAAPAPPPSQRSMLGRATLGLALVAVGVVALADNLSPATAIAPGRYVALVLVIVGGGLLVGAWRGRARGLIPVGLLLLPLLAATTMFASGAPWQGGVGERVWRPAELAEVRDEYRLGSGQMLLDLSAVDFDGEERVIEASVGLGQLDVVVPGDVDVDVNARTNGGELDLLGETAGGTRLRRTVSDPAAGDGAVTLHLRNGLGQITVERTDG